MIDYIHEMVYLNATGVLCNTAEWIRGLERHDREKLNDDLLSSSCRNQGHLPCHVVCHRLTPTLAWMLPQKAQLASLCLPLELVPVFSFRVFVKATALVRGIVIVDYSRVSRDSIAGRLQAYSPSHPSLTRLILHRMRLTLPRIPNPLRWILPQSPAAASEMLCQGTA